jgi:hypothetical protein
MGIAIDTLAGSLADRWAARSRRVCLLCSYASWAATYLESLIQDGRRSSIHGSDCDRVE